MNFKSLALGSVLALGSIFGGVTSAEAAPASCWIGAPTESVSSQYCDHYLPEKGEHVVYIGDTTMEFELYEGGYATISVDGARPVDGSWMYHSDGGIQVTNDHNGYFFIFERR